MLEMWDTWVLGNPSVYSCGLSVSTSYRNPEIRPTVKMNVLMQCIKALLFSRKRAILYQTFL